MTFDPFNDFEIRGYLRNYAALRDPVAVKEFEHRAFLAKLEQAFRNLGRIGRLTYRDVLATHKTLFESVYPWAGQDRRKTAPDIAVSKGEVLFAHPKDARSAVEYGLRLGQDEEIMRDRPGEVMGYLAYGHPFLDGNGRTILVVHSELAQRAGFAIDWGATDKTAWLAALTRELDSPGKGHLDDFLKPHIRPSIGHENLVGHIARTRGLDGGPDQPNGSNEVLGRFSEPPLQVRYRQQQQQRRQGLAPAPRRISSPP